MLEKLKKGFLFLLKGELGLLVILTFLGGLLYLLFG
jgi:hypothetical protein